MTKQKTNIKNFDTIYLKKSINGKYLNSKSMIFIQKGYYDVIASNPSEFLLAINTSGDGQKFQPDTKMIYIVDREELLKNAVLVHTN